MEKTIDYKEVAHNYAVKSQLQREIFNEFASTVHYKLHHPKNNVENYGLTWKVCNHSICKRGRELALKVEGL